MFLAASQTNIPLLMLGLIRIAINSKDLYGLSTSAKSVNVIFVVIRQAIRKVAISIYNFSTLNTLSSICKLSMKD